MCKISPVMSYWIDNGMNEYNIIGFCYPQLKLKWFIPQTNGILFKISFVNVWNMVWFFSNATKDENKTRISDYAARWSVALINNIQKQFYILFLLLLVLFVIALFCCDGFISARIIQNENQFVLSSFAFFMHTTSKRLFLTSPATSQLKENFMDARTVIYFLILW